MSRLGVDLGGTFNLVGVVLRYLGLAFLFPAVIALGYDEPVWPFAVSGVITSGAGIVLEAATAGRERIGPREGFLVAALIWLLVPAFGGLGWGVGGDERWPKHLRTPTRGAFGSEIT